MFYKPKYCCDCGEKIEKTDRIISVSGRFCDVCRVDFKLHEWLSFTPLIGGIILSLFGMSSLLQKNEKPLNLTAKQTVESAPNQKKEVKDNKTQFAVNSNGQNPADFNNRLIAEKQSPTAKNHNEKTGSESVKTKVSETEPTYFCGAATKKGSPCSRRVKGGGRCWQHAGQTAILSNEKLVINR